MRQIFLLVVFVLAARWLVKTMRAAQTEAGPRSGGARAGGASRGAGAGAGMGTGAQREQRQLAEPMVRCAACGVHSPKSDSVRAGEQYFCSVEHAQRFAARAAGREGR